MRPSLRSIFFFLFWQARPDRRLLVDSTYVHSAGSRVLSTMRYVVAWYARQCDFASCRCDANGRTKDENGMCWAISLEHRILVRYRTPYNHRRGTSNGWLSSTRAVAYWCLCSGSSISYLAYCECCGTGCFTGIGKDRRPGDGVRGMGISRESGKRYRECSITQIDSMKPVRCQLSKAS